MIPQGRDVVQNAFVVADIEAAARRWVAVAGIGPFFITRHVQVAESYYRGQTRFVDFSIAMAQAGSVQIELIQQHDDGPSCYRDVFSAGQEGFHHVAVIAGDYDRELAAYLAQGMTLVQNGRLNDLRYCYLAAPGLGCMIEVVEDKPSIRAYFAMVRKAAADWDGATDPVRFLN